MQFHVALVPSDKPLVAKAANLAVANLTLQNYNSQWVAALLVITAAVVVKSYHF